MFNLLKGMPFHLVTGFGKSTSTFLNNQNNICGQGVLQGSRSAGHIFILNSDISLSTYRKHGSGTAFYHPINGTIIKDNAIQYINDASQFLNHIGANIDTSQTNDIGSALIQHAEHNSQLWADSMWISGGGPKSKQMLLLRICTCHKLQKKKNPMYRPTDAPPSSDNKSCRQFQTPYRAGITVCQSQNTGSAPFSRWGWTQPTKAMPISCQRIPWEV